MTNPSGTRSNKYGAKREVCDGITFHSKREAARYRDLKLLEKAAHVKDLELQKPLPISINGILVCKYIADFMYREAGVLVIEDCKGYRTQLYRLKRKMVEAAYGVKIRET